MTQVKLLGSYTFPYDIVVAGTFQSTDGPEVSGQVTFSTASLLTSSGRPLSGTATRDINVIEPGTLYGERQNQVDLRLSKIFTFGGTRAQAMFDLYNVLNANAVTDFDRQFGTPTVPNPSFLLPAGIMPGRLAKFAFQFNF